MFPNFEKLAVFLMEHCSVTKYIPAENIIQKYTNYYNFQISILLKHLSILLFNKGCADLTRKSSFRLS